MSRKPFDIYEFVHNNKFTLDIDRNLGNRVYKGYNDVRKTNIDDVKIIDGKFTIKDNLDKINKK